MRCFGKCILKDKRTQERKKNKSNLKRNKQTKKKEKKRNEIQNALPGQSNHMIVLY